MYALETYLHKQVHHPLTDLRTDKLFQGQFMREDLLNLLCPGQLDTGTVITLYVCEKLVSEILSPTHKHI